MAAPINDFSNGSLSITGWELDWTFCWLVLLSVELFTILTCGAPPAWSGAAPWVIVSVLALAAACFEVGVEVEINNEIREQIHKHIKAVSNTITNLKTTMAWTWVHVNEDNRDTLKQYILQQLQVS